MHDTSLLVPEHMLVVIIRNSVAPLHLALGKFIAFPYKLLEFAFATDHENHSYRDK